MINKIITGFLLCFVVSMMSFLPLQSSQAAERINSVQIEGNQRVENDTILSYLDLRNGDAFSPEAINESLKKLYATGLFSDVAINRRGDDLVVTVAENPVINKIAFEGNKRIKDDELEKELSLKPRSVYSTSAVQADVKRIQDLYSKSGRFSVKVEPKAIQLDQNRLNLVYEIEEGDKTTVQKITFVGNERYGTDRLKKVISTRKSQWYNFFSSADTYDPGRISYDKELLRKFYVSHGYADFRVDSSVAEITKDRDAFNITFIIEEGRKYDFGEVAIDSKLEEISGDELKKEVLTKEGEEFNAELIEQTIDAMTEKLNDVGYAFVEVSPRFKRDPEANKMGITYAINEGPKVYVNRINIDGNVRTLDKVIRREFRVTEGDPFNASKIRRSKQRLENLGFFETVDIERERVSENDKIDIDVKVKEKSTGELNFGAGYSTTDGAIGSASIRERNLLGKGQDLKLGFQQATRGSQVDLSFTEPYFMDKPLAAGFDLYRLTRDMRSESSYDSETTGGALRAGYDLTEHLRHNIRYSVKRDNISGVGASASTYIQRQIGENTTSLVGHTLTYDRRDSVFDPTEGYYIKLDEDIAGLGGDSKFFRNELRGGYYYPVYNDDVVLSISGKGGIIVGLGEDVRINERFFVGGSQLRGFKNAGIGPRDISTGDALGGNQYYVGTAEVTFPLGLPEELGFKGAAFTEVGSLWNTDDKGANISDDNSLRGAAGIGLAWKSPIGPVRIDFSTPFMKESYDEVQHIQFNFGTRF